MDKGVFSLALAFVILAGADGSRSLVTAQATVERGVPKPKQVESTPTSGSQKVWSVAEVAARVARFEAPLDAATESAGEDPQLLKEAMN